MEFVALEVNRGEVRVADLDAGFVGILVQCGLHAQTFIGRDAADEVDHHLPAQQRSTAPVVGDVPEHAMLDLVPLAGAWRKMAHLNLQAEFIGQPLKLQPPQAHATAVAAGVHSLSAIRSKYYRQFRQRLSPDKKSIGTASGNEVRVIFNECHCALL